LKEAAGNNIKDSSTDEFDSNAAWFFGGGKNVKKESFA
jgi:hypothetical protein